MIFLSKIYTTINFTRLSVVSVTVGVHTLSFGDAERYRCACLHCTQGLAGRGDGYQCGLHCGRSSITDFQLSQKSEPERP